MTWTGLADSLFGVGKPTTASLLKALRDNIASVVSPDDNVPTNRATWHPYNRTVNADTNDGLVYDFATSGAVTVVTSPDFVDKFEYRMVLRGLTTSSASPNLGLALYQATTDAYTATAALWSTQTGGRTGMITVPFARASFASQIVHVHNDVEGIFSVPIGLAAAEKVKRMRLICGTGTINGGKVYLYRRMTHYGI